ncbi:EamA family transporter [Marinomonas agarivorans]|nr:EamA family transporter [Marinomonas agarivorans]
MATTLGILALLLWSMLALLGTLTTDIPALQLLSLCFFISALLMPIKRLVNGKSILKKPALTKPQWLIGIMGLFGFHLCYFLALKFAPAIEVSLIVYTWPLLLTLFVSSTHTRLSAAIGGLLGFIGIVFIVAGGNEVSLDNRYVLGYLLSLACAIIWSSYSWFLTRSQSHVDDVGWLSLLVALFALIAHFSFEADQGKWQLSWQEWIGVILLGLGPVGGAFYLWDIALKQGNRVLLASLSFGTPLLSAIILALAGLNAWSINIVIALILILAGAIIANKNWLRGVETKLYRRFATAAKQPK